MNVDVRRSLRPLQARFAAPLLAHLREFWTWWSGELGALLPQRARAALAQRRQKLFVEAGSDGLTLSLGTWAESREVARVAMDGPAEAAEVPRDAQQNILLLPTELVLGTSLTLPLAAEENLAEVLAFEMDQHTPFLAGQVYFDYKVTARDSERQQLTVDLVFSPRSRMDPYLEAAADLGITPDVVTSRSQDTRNYRAVNLLPAAERRQRRTSIHRLNVALAAGMAVLLAIAIVLPIAQKDAALEALDAQVQSAAAEAREGNQLRRDLERMAAATRFLTDKKQASIMAVELVDEVSRILPDDTWVSRLDITATEMQIQGQSGASASLIAIVESSPHFANARFRSPVVQVQGTEADRFHLSADIVRSEAP